jgi:hypothetical protein
MTAGTRQLGDLGRVHVDRDEQEAELEPAGEGEELGIDLVDLQHFVVDHVHP